MPKAKKKVRETSAKALWAVKWKITLLPRSNGSVYFQEEDLDSQQGVIDFSLYLRSNKDSNSESVPDDGSMTAVLDQKHYIEELNRHLK